MNGKIVFEELMAKAVKVMNLRKPEKQKQTKISLKIPRHKTIALHISIYR